MAEEGMCQPMMPPRAPYLSRRHHQHTKKKDHPIQRREKARQRRRNDGPIFSRNKGLLHENRVGDGSSPFERTLN
jgi:hypothetical protein